MFLLRLMSWKEIAGMIPNRGIIIGITGGIATGKSTLSRILNEYGFIVIDSDKIAREVVRKGSKGLEMIVHYFGEDILRKDGTLDRKKLGNLIFRDSEKRTILNQILHPLIAEKINQVVKENIGNNNVIFIDVPLLFEERKNLEDSGLSFDEVWLVYANEKLQLQRLMERDNISREEAILKIESQLGIEEKRKLSDVVIDNEGSISDLTRRIEELTLKYR